MSKQDNTQSGGSTYEDPLTTKGDLLSFSTLTARLAVGTDDHILTADSGETLGVKWAAASGGSGPTTGSFALANNQTSATNITGLIFDKASIRAAEIFASTFTDSTFGDKATVSTLHLITDGSTWAIIEDTKQSTVASNIVYSVTSAGQLQYTSPNDGGFTSSVVKWSYNTTPV